MPYSGIRVRRAQAEDLLAVFRLAVAMHKEADRYKHVPLSEERLEWTLQQLYMNGLVLVAEEGQEIVGTFWGVLDQYFFSDTRFASDVLLYVAPAHRRGVAAKRLISVFEQWAREAGVEEIILGISVGGDDAERYARFYGHLGYRVAGYNTFKRA